MKAGPNLGAMLFKNKIIETINKSDCPIVVMRLELESILADLRAEESRIVEQEAAEYMAGRQAEQEKPAPAASLKENKRLEVVANG